MFMDHRSQKNCGPESEESSGNEICKSLKMFAAEISFNLEPSKPKQSIDSIMEDFSKNGYHCDENNQQQQQHNRIKTKTVKNVLQVKGQLTKISDLVDKKPLNRYDKAEKLINPNQSCAFCENNKEPIEVVKSHNLRDVYGRVLCPKLRVYTCPICKASGDNAHTVKYCPKKPIITVEDTIRTESYRLAKATYFKHGMKI